MDIALQLKEELGVRKEQVESAIALIDEGNTIPFIARYRKEATGGLNDEILRNLDERLSYLRNLEEKKGSVISTIEEQGKLTTDLRAKIEAAPTLVVLEDLYRPYRPKRRTRAMIAREKGLAPLAEQILQEELSLPAMELAEDYVDLEKEVDSAKAALAGAMDIIAEEMADNAELRIWIREQTKAKGKIKSSAKDPEAQSVYELYYDFEEPIANLPGHRTLALNRGEKEKILQVKVIAPEAQILSHMKGLYIHKPSAFSAPVLEETIADAYQRLIAPAIEREIRNLLTESAEDGAIRVFGKNLQQLLLQAPISGQTVLGWDPAFRTGCKLAVVDPTGKVLETKVIYPTAPQNKVEESKRIVKQMIAKHKISLISVGNGTASRESEQIIVELLSELPKDQKVSYTITNEAGASVYSASKLASEEFPQFDVGQRSATSIARRVQDPLAELVKIDPKSIGVGQYQHDMNQKKLSETLGGVVEASVNQVGVDLNTASAPLLSYVSGVSASVAKNIVSYREAQGAFTSRRELLKVPKLGPKAFEQCAGFLRIRGAVNPLDATSVHPESYSAAEELLLRLGHNLEEVSQGGIGQIASEITDPVKMADDLGIGQMTLEDIIDELAKPGRDPREDMPKPILRQDVLSMEDLVPGMVLKGTVRNVIDFGAFVDIGVHQDGLVHISRICDKFIKHPLEAVSVGDIVDVQVVSVDQKKQRIALSMRIGKDVDGEGRELQTSADRKENRKKSTRSKRQGSAASKQDFPVRKDGSHPKEKSRRSMGNSDMLKALSRIKL